MANTITRYLEDSIFQKTVISSKWKKYILRIIVYAIIAVAVEYIGQYYLVFANRIKYFIVLIFFDFVTTLFRDK